MPKIRTYDLYDTYDDIRKNTNVVSQCTKITKHLLKHSAKIRAGNDFVLYRFMIEDDFCPNPVYRYVMMKGSRISEEKFTKSGYLRMSHFIGFMDIERTYLRTKHNGPFDVSVIQFVYVSTQFRGQGHGRQIYDLILDEEQVVASGDSLHTERGKVTASLGIWQHYLSKKYPIVTCDTRTKEIREYKDDDPAALRSAKVRFLISNKHKWVSALTQNLSKY